jgi:hypothetical protein
MGFAALSSANKYVLPTFTSCKIAYIPEKLRLDSPNLKKSGKEGAVQGMGSECAEAETANGIGIAHMCESPDRCV